MKMVPSDSKTLILILLLLFVSGLIFSSYVVYSSFNLIEEKGPDNLGKISLTIIPEPEAPPEATGRSTIAFEIIERPEE